MATIRGIITLFLALCCLCTNARVHLAQRVPQRLDARSSSAGGWVLVDPTCPSGSTACPSVLGSNAATCCPNDMTCQYDINTDQHFCCPSGMPLSHSTPLRRDRETNNQCYCRFQLPSNNPRRPGVCWSELEPVLARRKPTRVFLLFAQSSWDIERWLTHWEL